MYRLKEAEVRAIFQDYCLDKISFSRAVEILNEKVKLKRTEFDIDLLISSEKYRMFAAVKTCNTQLEVIHKLGMSERTFYRRVKEYNLDLSKMRIHKKDGIKKGV